MLEAGNSNVMWLSFSTILSAFRHLFGRVYKIKDKMFYNKDIEKETKEDRRYLPNYQTLRYAIQLDDNCCFDNYYKIQIFQV